MNPLLAWGVTFALALLCFFGALHAAAARALGRVTLRQWTIFVGLAVLARAWLVLTDGAILVGMGWLSLPWPRAVVFRGLDVAGWIWLAMCLNGRR